jgi:unsaturated chondroitin disaccharide hydrolase
MQGACNKPERYGHEKIHLLMKKIIASSACLLICSSLLPAQKNRITVSYIDQQLRSATAQYKTLIKRVPDNEFPRSYDPATGRLITSNSSWWCSGFYPGTLLYLYEYSKDDTLKAEAIKRLAWLENEQYNKNTHDLGFMMYCSFGNAYRLWHDEKHRSILINSAHSLASRFNTVTNTIRSWNFGDWKYPVIIDNMMNLELLTWAAAAGHDPLLKKIAMAHATTTLENHFRANYSSYHLVDYDPATGTPIKKQTVQGAADNSTWARGQGWALYGFTTLFRETGDRQYLEQARGIAAFILQRLPKDNIPYWDFDAPGIPNALKDASAAAVMASSLIELSGYITKRKEKKEYLTVAASMLTVLASPEYSFANGQGGGFILKHSVGNLPADSEIDVPLSYADYYYIEALLRYRKILMQ